MADEVEYIDLRPSQAYQGTAMVPEGDYDIVDARFAMWDYNGKQPTAVPALGVEFKDGDQDYIQWYSAGDVRNLKPSDDGKKLVKNGPVKSLNNATNCFQFLTSLIRAEFDEEWILNDISSIIGLRVHIVHEATVEREIKGVKKQAGTMAVVGKILNDPSKGKPATKGTSKKANGQQTAVAPQEIAKKTTPYLIAALKGAPNGTLPRKELGTAVFQKIPGTENDRNKMLGLLIQDAYLGSLVDDGILLDTERGQVVYIGG